MADEIDYKKNPDKAGAEQAKAEGNEFYKNKKYNDALEKYSEAHMLDPMSPIYLGNRSAVYMALEKFNLSLTDSAESIKLDPTYTKGYSRLIKCNIALGNLGAAKSVINEIKNGNLNFGKPIDVQFKQEIDQINQLERSLCSAKMAESKKDYREAAFYYKQASYVAVADTSIINLIAKFTALSGNVIEAHQIILKVLQKSSTDAIALTVRGICFYLEDNTEKALQHFTQALRMAPDMTEAKEYRTLCKKLQAIKSEGNAAFKSSNFNKAIEIYTDALNIDATNKITNAKLYFNRALARSKLKESDPDLAEKRDLLIIKDCNQAIKLDSSYIKAYRRRAYAYQNVGDHQNAVNDFEYIFKLEKTRENRDAVSQAKRKQKLAERKDYYKILKVSRDADDKDIKKAYRKQALLHHPDRHANSSDDEKALHEKNFKDVNEAFSILSDEKKKSRYDNGQDLEDGGMGGFSSGGIDPNIIFSQFFGGGSPFSSGMGGGGQEFVFSFG